MGLREAASWGRAATLAAVAWFMPILTLGGMTDDSYVADRTGMLAVAGVWLIILVVPEIMSLAKKAWFPFWLASAFMGTLAIMSSPARWASPWIGIPVPQLGNGLILWGFCGMAFLSAASLSSPEWLRQREAVLVSIAAAGGLLAVTIVGMGVATGITQGWVAMLSSSRPSGLLPNALSASVALCVYASAAWLLGRSRGGIWTHAAAAIAASSMATATRSAAFSVVPYMWPSKGSGRRGWLAVATIGIVVVGVLGVRVIVNGPIMSGTGERTVLLKRGLVLIKERPMGYGVLPASRPVTENTDFVEVTDIAGLEFRKSHNPVLDLVLVLGVPAVLLMAALCLVYSVSSGAGVHWRPLIAIAIASSLYYLDMFSLPALCIMLPWLLSNPVSSHNTRAQ